MSEKIKYNDFILATFDNLEDYDKHVAELPAGSLALIKSSGRETVLSTSIERIYQENGNLHFLLVDGRDISIGTVQGPKGDKGDTGAPGVIVSDSQPEGDQVWLDPNDSAETDFNFKGATATKGGSGGLVPPPPVGSQNKFLAGDGTWKEIGTGSGAGISSIGLDNNGHLVITDTANNTYVSPNQFYDKAYLDRQFNTVVNKISNTKSGIQSITTRDKNLVINKPDGTNEELTVPYANTAQRLQSEYIGTSNRPRTANIPTLNNSSVRYFLATDSMKEAKPATDGGILQFGWDNSAYDSQLFVPNNIRPEAHIQVRTQANSPNWSNATAWRSVAWLDEVYTKTQSDNKYLTEGALQPILDELMR